MPGLGLSPFRFYVEAIYIWLAEYLFGRNVNDIDDNLYIAVSYYLFSIQTYDLLLQILFRSV